MVEAPDYLELPTRIACFHPPRGSSISGIGHWESLNLVIMQQHSDEEHMATGENVHILFTKTNLFKRSRSGSSATLFRLYKAHGCHTGELNSIAHSCIWLMIEFR